VATYRIVPDESRVLIDAKSSLHAIHTSASGLEGRLDLDVPGGERVDLRTAATATLSLPVGALKSGNLLEDREVQRRIDARRFPTITGELDELAATGEERQYLARGRITFRGVTNNYEDEVTISRVDANTLRVEGAHTFDIRDFGMEPPKILMLRVEPTVNVRVEIVARKDR
jgi:polyisoprenoid-binding protein YceI